MEHSNACCVCDDDGGKRTLRLVQEGGWVSAVNVLCAGGGGVQSHQGQHCDGRQCHIGCLCACVGVSTAPIHAWKNVLF